MKRPLFFHLIFAVLAGTFLVSCDSPDKKYEKYIERGDAYYQEHDYIKARLDYKNAARIMPADPRAIYSLGLVEEMEGNLQSALSAFLIAEQQDPSYMPVLLKLAAFYLTAQRFEDVRDRIHRILDIDPNNATAHALQSSVLLKEKAFDDAEREVETALRYDPSNIIAYSVLTGLHVARNDPETALAVLEKGLALNPGELSFYLLKAAIYSEQGDIDAIARTYRDIFALQPDAIRFRFDLAKILADAGKTGDAGTVYQETVRAFPDNPEAKHRLAAFLEKKRGMAAAEEEIHSYIQSAPQQKIFYLWLADLYVRNDQDDRAISTLKNVIDNEPGDWVGLNASTALAQIQMNKGDADLALRLIDAVLKKDVNNEEALFLRASLAFSQGDYQKAVADFRTILRDAPDSPKTARILAEALRIQGHTDLAIDTLIQIVRNHPDNKNALTRLAQLQALAGNRSRALEIAATVTETDPAYPVGWETLARLAIEDGQWKTAKDATAHLAQLEGQEKTALFLEGRIFAASGDVRRGTALYRKVISADPAAPLAAYALSSLIETADAPDDLKDVRNFLLSLDTEDPTILTVLGNIDMALGDSAAAETALRTALLKKPRTQAPYLSLAKLLNGQQETEQALEILQKAQTALPSENAAAMMHAGLLLKSGKTDAAISLYEDILTRDASLDAAANNLAQLIADRENRDKAALERARLLAERFINSANPAYLDTLGWVYFRLGLIQQAQGILSRAAALDKTSNPQIHYHYGALLLKTGRTDEAMEHLRRALSGDTYPGYENAQALLQTHE